MWEAIKTLGQNPVTIVAILCITVLIFYAIKKGLFSFKGKGITIGLSEQNTRDLIQNQFEYAKAKIEGVATTGNFPENLDVYRLKYILARVEDVIQKAIVFNNMCDKESYIHSKQELVYQTIMKRVDNDFFKTSEFKDFTYKFIEDLFKELYQMKKDFKNEK